MGRAIKVTNTMVLNDTELHILRTCMEWYMGDHCYDDNESDLFDRIEVEIERREEKKQEQERRRTLRIARSIKR